MLRQDDLGAAVAGGIWTEAQDGEPRAFALKRERQRISMLRNKKGFGLMQLGISRAAASTSANPFTPTGSLRQLSPVSA
jgi:hypothetical protein